MSSNGWIKLHRKIQDNELWLSEKFTKSQAWIDMLLLANHKKNMFFLRGNEVHVERGQIARSEQSLARRWRWSREKVRRFLSFLKTRQQIEQQKSNVINIITIKNYDEYQSNETTEKQQKNTNKNVKKKKKEKKERILPKNLDEVIQVFKEKKIKYPEIQAEIFWNHYELKNWTYGKDKTPIKNWKLCIAQWKFEIERLPL